MLSIIVPTFNEKDNIASLCQRIEGALTGEDFEILFVDDSNDDTPQVIAERAREDAHVRLLHREERGLSTAVVAGFGAARGELVAVIDGDLQHPPEVLAQMLKIQQDTGPDMVVPSRYADGGNPGGLDGGFRKMLSRGGKLIAQIILPEARKTTDPMSGCFLVTRDAVEPLVGTRPFGWKIMLDVLVRGRVRRVAEVPYTFAERVNGQSKLGWKVQMDFAHQLLALAAQRAENRRFAAFSVIGASGVMVNEAAFAALAAAMGRADIAIASVLASHIAMAWNFAWNARFTWRERWDRRHWGMHALRYLIVSEIGVGLTAGVLLALRAVGSPSDLLNQLVGIVLAVLVGFRLNDRWTWAEKTPQARTAKENA